MNESFGLFFISLPLGAAFKAGAVAVAKGESETALIYLLPAFDERFIPLPSFEAPKAVTPDA